MALEPPTLDLSVPGSVVYEKSDPVWRSYASPQRQLGAIDWVQVRPGMERKTFAGEGATLALFRIQPGHERLPHSHHYEQIVYMLRGTANFHVGEEVHRLTGGCLLVIPPRHALHRRAGRRRGAGARRVHPEAPGVRRWSVGWVKAEGP